MTRRLDIHRTVLSLCFFTCLTSLCVGLSCPAGDNLNPSVPYGNRSPRVVLTGVTPTNVSQGDNVSIGFAGEDGEDVAVVRLFASTSLDPTPAQEIPLLDGFAIGPGAGSGSVTWDTDGVPAGAYFIYAEIDDRTYDPITGLGNQAIRTTYGSSVEITIPGTTPLTNPPKLDFIVPTVNLGLSSEDDVTVRYRYNDSDSGVLVTLLLDTDLDPTNDNISSPGNPLDPNVKIIILPSTDPLATDPPIEGIRTNPQELVATTLTEPWVTVEYRFKIVLSQIPVRTTPYYLRATVNDGTSIIHSYAEGSLTVSAMAQGTVDAGDLGFGIAGARFHGFSVGENLGSDFVSMDDLDLDGCDDFLIAGRFASPRNRYQAGAAYLIFGRRKTPFPADTNGNGIPDVAAPDGTVVDFPPPPTYVTNPYDASNVGRFGGTNSINSTGQFFRGSLFAMPMAHGTRKPPPEVLDPNAPDYGVHDEATTGGLTSITRFDMNLDGTPDLVFGLPFISDAREAVDDDPSDGCEVGRYIDSAPNWRRCTGAGATNDDLFTGPDIVNQGMVIMVDGTTDIRNNFRLFVDAQLAGQFDQDGTPDDENVQRGGTNQIPNGMRIRGAWFDSDWDQLLEGSDCCVMHPGPGCVDLDGGTDCQTTVCAIPGYEYCCEDGESWDIYCAFAAYFFCNECPEFGAYNYTSTSQYGRTVSVLPRVDNDTFDELMVSAPYFDPLDPRVDVVEGGLLDRERGRVTVWWSNVMTGAGYFGDSVLSLPGYTTCPGGGCTQSSGDTVPAYCCRAWVTLPTFNDIYGQEPGDCFGYAAAGGDFNQDGTRDITAGAPKADRNGLVDCGVTYIFEIGVGGFGDIDMANEIDPYPRVEIIGTHSYDRFGEVQTGVEDMSMDSIVDVAIASEWYDGPAGVDSGYVGILFGNRPITGELGFSPEEVGTYALPGIRFYGTMAGAHAGHDVSSAGDFNGDGVADLLISCPGETRTVNGVLRKGVVYLIFGGQHLVDWSFTADTHFNLSQVGTTALPGIVFISRFPAGTVDEAPLDTVGSLGDIDADGFDDIIMGATTADFVNPYSPSQRRLDVGEVYVIYGSNHGTNTLP
jgi:hypothetical protein